MSIGQTTSSSLSATDTVMAALAHAGISIKNTTDDSLRRLFRLLTPLFGVDCVFVTLLSSDDGSRVCSDSSCARLLAAAPEIGTAVLAHANPLILREDEHVPGVNMAALGLRFFAGIALRDAAGAAIGTLCLASRLTSRDPSVDRQTLEDAAHLVSREICHERTERAARDAWDVIMEAIETLPDGFVLYDENDRLKICNEQYRQTYPETAHVIQPGRSFEEIIREGVRCGQYLEAIGCEDDWIAKRLEDHLHPTGPVEQHLPDGRWVRVLEKRLPSGGTVGFRVDITELKQRQSELYELAHRDELTGTMSRRAILSAARDCGTRARARGEPLSLMILDIDKFKTVNDELGHFAGDEVLKEFCRRIESQLRAPDFFGRLGGEEFLVILPDTSASESVERAERMRTLLSATPITLEDNDIALTMSLGVTDYRKGETMDDAFARADRLLYRAKEQGRDRTVAEFLDPSPNPSGH